MNRSELRALAEAARDGDFDYGTARYLFEVSADPSTVLALLDRLEAAEALLREANDWDERGDEGASGDLWTAYVAHRNRIRAFLAEDTP